MKAKQGLNIIIKAVGALLLAGFIGLIVIQFIPVNRSNPPVVGEPQWDSAQTRALAERACFDCHSNQTKWTWYSKIAPVSLLVAHDVREGRAALNYSEWGTTGQEAEEAAEQVTSGAMPPWQYLLIHPEARLNDAEKQALIAGLNATFGSEDEEGEQGHEEGREAKGRENEETEENE